MVEQLAVLVYGVLAIVAALVLSSQTDAPLATALAFAAAGLTYLFQVFQLEGHKGPELAALWTSTIIALLLSVLVSLGAFYHVL